MLLLPQAQLVSYSPEIIDAEGLSDGGRVQARRIIGVEPLVLSDSLTVQIISGRSVSDAESLSDSASLSINASVSDAAALSDLLSLIAASSVSDAEGLSDSLILSVSRSVQNDDNAGLSDALSVSQSKAFVVSDSAPLSDLIAVSAAKETTDSFGLSDNLVSGQSKFVSFDDSAVLSDSLMSAQSKVLAVNDSEAVTESFSFAQSRAVTINDSNGLVDDASSGQNKAFVDALIVSDGLIFDRSIAFTDIEGISDSPTQIARALRDVQSAGLTDTVSVLVIPTSNNFTASVSDSAGTADNYSLNRTLSVSDAVNTADTVIQSVGSQLVDSCGLSDAIARSLFNSVSDTCDISDVVAQAFSKSTNDAVGISDSVSPVVAAGTILRSIADAEGITDSPARFARSLTDSHALDLSDSMSVALIPMGSNFTASINNSLGLSDTPARSALAAIRSDTAYVYDAVTAQIIPMGFFTRTVDDNFDLSDQDDPESVISLWYETVNDALGVSDEVLRRVDLRFPGTNTVGLSDGLSVVVGFSNPTLFETESLRDELLVARASSQTDAAGVTDFVEVERSFERIDALSLSDSLLLEKAKASVLTEDFNLADALNIQILPQAGTTYFRTIDDVLGLTDLAQARPLYVSDILGLRDDLQPELINPNAENRIWIVGSPQHGWQANTVEFVLWLIGRVEQRPTFEVGEPVGAWSADSAQRNWANGSPEE